MYEIISFCSISNFYNGTKLRNARKKSLGSPVLKLRIVTFHTVTDQFLEQSKSAKGRKGGADIIRQMSN